MFSFCSPPRLVFILADLFAEIGKYANLNLAPCVLNIVPGTNARLTTKPVKLQNSSEGL